MTIAYRYAVPLDWSQLVRLYGEFVEQPERYLAGGEDGFREVLDSDQTKIIVACTGSGLVGFVCFSWRPVFRYPRPIVEIEEIFVLPEYRRQGVGRELMEEVKRFAEDLDAYYIFLASDRTRTEAHAFYKELEFDDYAYHFRRKC